MRLLLPCMKCHMEFGRPEFVLYQADVLDTRIAGFTCRHGHKSLHAIQSHKFELLAELAVNAILDGYTREAVLSFTSAQERFNEFYIRVVARQKKTDKGNFEKLWKLVGRLSERQLGAYFFTHLFEEGKAPPVLDQNTHVAFRNRVIHGGLIPTRDEAEEYGQAILDVINPVLARCVAVNKEVVMDFAHDGIRSGYSEAGADETVSTLGLPTIIDALRNPSEPCPTLSDWLVYSQKMRNGMEPQRHS